MKKKTKEALTFNVLNTDNSSLCARVQRLVMVLNRCNSDISVYQKQNKEEIIFLNQ